MVFGWHMPVNVRFGDGIADEWPRALNGRHAVVLALDQADALGWRTRIEQALGERLLDWIAVSDGLSSLARCRDLAPRVWAALARAPQAVLVAIGGGTTLDMAKVLRLRPQAPYGFEAVQGALRGASAWPQLDLAELWMVPTTAGTGSEVTRWATVWDTDTVPAQKRSFDEAFGYASRAFVDPLLTHSCPPSVTRDTGLDALSHALEAIWNRHANPFSDDLALAAARRVIAFLPIALRYPRHADARRELSLASLQAGLAFSQTRTALAHALSYSLTLEQGVPHGLACGVWLPTAWALACGCDPRIDRMLARVFVDPESRSGRPAGRASAQADVKRLQAWLIEVGAPPDPASLGVVDAPQRVEDALRSPRGRNFVASP